MNIGLNLLSNFVTPFISKPALSSLTTQKKILVIASIALAFLALYLAANRYCFKENKGLPQNDKLSRSSSSKETPKEKIKDEIQQIGKIIFKEATFTAEYRGGILMGQGKIAMADGLAEFDGEFTVDILRDEGFKKEHLLYGNGKITFTDGTVFEGEFINGDLDGKGKKTYPNGKVEEGKFENDILIGNLV
jgi:hypothetical protein